MYTISWLWHIVLLPNWASRNSTIQGLLLPLLQPPLGQWSDLWLLSTVEWWFWVNLKVENYTCSIYLFIYFKWNHNGHQFCELILIKQRSLDGKGWFDWRKLFKFVFVNGGSKRNLLGTAMIVDAFLETVRTSTHLVEFDHFKHGNCAYSSLVTRWFDSSRCHWNNPCSDEKFAQSFVSKEAYVGSDGWYMFVVCTDVSFHIYKGFFQQRNAKGVCDM